MTPQAILDNHRFLDEAGDTTFYTKGKVPIIGQAGVSQCFILGMVKFREPLPDLRRRIIDLQNQVVADPYFRDIPSLNKKVREGGFYFHATDDVPEVRKVFYDFIASIDCSFEAYVGRKIPLLYQTKHNGKEAEFYADLLSHLLKNKLNKKGKMVLNIASRGKTTRNHNLQLALEKAQTQNRRKSATTQIVFNVQNHRVEPLLNVADYFCWSIQRVFERGEVRYYNFLKDRISLVVDLYDSKNFSNSQNFYKPQKPLTASNKV
ncbi:MAG: DUF3800 domain-containing protein [Lewinellaceae bacterium]|nr:DUF3800 domain-containing protein [Lewinellaceae bacterium]